MGGKKKNLVNHANVTLKDLDNNDSESEVDINNNELETLQKVLQINEKNPKEWKKIRFVFYATALFAIFSLPFIDKIYQLIFSNSSSWLIILAMKVITFFVLYYIIVYLCKN